MGQGALNSGRRALLASAAAWPWAACTRDSRQLEGGWVGASHERGHQLRDLGKSGRLPDPAVRQRCAVAVIGAGVAGIACARVLAAAGVSDVRVFELEDNAGGNSRDHAMSGMRCPLGAHYLPTPGEQAFEVQALLEALSVRHIEHGRATYDERHLCHAPQERILIDGAWHDGLLPPLDALPVAERERTATQYRRFEQQVTRLAANGAFAIPTARSRGYDTVAGLDTLIFAQWLTSQGFDAPALRWYLDYCCRDDYGTGAAQVSAWAGVHYFASRHGFHAPGSAADAHDAVLTWPQGNAWLIERMTQPIGDRIQTGCVALQIEEGRHDVAIDLWNVGAKRMERCTADHVVLATPLFVAARLLRSPPPALIVAASLQRHAPWLVANLQVDAPLLQRHGAPRAWDNIAYASSDLGYVDATHQNYSPQEGPTVLTAYRSLASDDNATTAQRRALLTQPWSAWADIVLRDLAVMHPEIRDKLVRIDLMRYGHAMSIPIPGLRSSAALHALTATRGHIVFAHADLSGYSIFEEALYHGERAARGLLSQMNMRSRPI